MREPVACCVDRASEAEILEHLRRCDASFVPPLSSRVDLPAYAARLATRATRFEAWRDGVLVGLVAAYCNDFEGGSAYVTSVSVLDEAVGEGIASCLLVRCVDHARGLGLRRIALEVSEQNARARKLYERHGFRLMVTPLRPQITMYLDLEKCG